MDSAEFAEWMQEYRLEPWGEDRADLRMGIFASAMANLHTSLRETMLALWAKGWKKSVQKPFTPVDFFPNFSRPIAIQQGTPVTATPQPQSQSQNTEQLQAFFLSLTQQVGGTVHGVQNGHA